MTEDNIELYMNLDNTEFSSIIKRATQESIDSDPNDKDSSKHLLFPNAVIFPDELYIEEKKDILHINGTIKCFGKELGFVSLDIPLSTDIATGIIDRYMKKLGKLKTVLEATK